MSMSDLSGASYYPGDSAPATTNVVLSEAVVHSPLQATTPTTDDVVKKIETFVHNQAAEPLFTVSTPCSGCLQLVPDAAAHKCPAATPRLKPPSEKKKEKTQEETLPNAEEIQMMLVISFLAGVGAGAALMMLLYALFPSK